MENKIIIGNVCFIRDLKSEQILLLKRSRAPMKGYYTGVGGKTDFYEDIHRSCLREIKEETGLDVFDLTCKGVLKTIQEGAGSSWILFMYVAEQFSGDLIECDEGELRWFSYKQIPTLPMIDFVREILPSILMDGQFTEGTVRHDADGRVLEKTLHFIRNS